MRLAADLETGTASRPHRRLAFIDALRAIAILLVFVRHAIEVYLPYGHSARGTYKLTSWLNCGALGVSIFFIISGFLIPSSLHGPRLPGAVRYLISRTCRLYPAFLVSVIPSAAAHIWRDHAFPWHTVLWNFTMLPRLFGAEMANGAYWTLEVEATFYAICLLLFLGGVLEQAFSFAAITLVTFLIFQSSQQPFFGGLFNPVLTGPTFFFLMDIALMCWGAVCRSWWSGARLNLITATIFWGVAAFWLLWRPAVLVHAALTHHLGQIDTKMIAAYAGALAIFLAAALHGGLRQPLLLWIGRISYSFYLLHGVAIHGVRHVLEWYPALQGRSVYLYSAIALALSLAMAQLSYSLVERPGIRLGRLAIDQTLRRLPARIVRPAGRSAWALLLAWRPYPGAAVTRREPVAPHEVVPPTA